MASGAKPGRSRYGVRLQRGRGASILGGVKPKGQAERARQTISCSSIIPSELEFQGLGKGPPGVTGRTA